MRTADNANSDSCINPTSSSHLGPEPNTNSEVDERHGPEVNASVPTTEGTSSKSQTQPGASRSTEETNTNKELPPFHR